MNKKGFNRQLLADTLSPNMLFELEDSFKFDCIQCGECCRNKNEDILLTGIDILKLSEELHMEPKQVILDYCKELETNTWILMLKMKRQEDGSCIMLDGNKCTVHNNKPFNCRLSPLNRISDFEGNEFYYIMNDFCSNMKNSTTEIKIKDWLCRPEFIEDSELNKKWISLFFQANQVFRWFVDRESFEENMKAAVKGLYFTFKDPNFEKTFEGAVEYLEYNLTGFIYRPELYYAEIK